MAVKTEKVRNKKTAAAPSKPKSKPARKIHETRAAGTKRHITGYGWKPDLPDHRDVSFVVPKSAMGNMPPRVDLRSHCPPVYTQGRINSCTANAIAAALQYNMKKEGMSPFMPSRLFIYYNERALEGTVGTDIGAYIRDGIKTVAKHGHCPEHVWPYDDTPADPATCIFPDGAPPAVTPHRGCYAAAVRHNDMRYHAIDQNLTDMRGCLAAGYPFVFGFTAYESFESDEVAATGNVPLPSSADKRLRGHAVLAVGYDDARNVFICRNSWGPEWGDGGYFYMPYAYLLDDNLAGDLWTINFVK